MILFIAAATIVLQLVAWAIVAVEPLSGSEPPSQVDGVAQSEGVLVIYPIKLND
jgi:hypothetical protein